MIPADRELPDWLSKSNHTTDRFPNRPAFWLELGDICAVALD
jgi:hypothetical protein